jgi:hypothetical protein
LLEAEIDCALIADYGAWAAGWNWAASEPAVAARFAAGAARATVCSARGTRGPRRRSNAWYATFAHVVTWYLEARGIEPERVSPVVHDTISGHFSSWIEPDSGQSRAACEALGLAVAVAETETAPTRNGLLEWLSLRRRAFVNPPAVRPRSHVRADGHLRYIEGPERARDRARSERMATALSSARAAAKRGKPLDFERLARLQGLVLGIPKAEFRTGDAFAKRGRERYPLEPDTRERFERCLDETRDTSVSAAVRAARVYLDVCFFHPFPDGNGRAARLALDYVLTSERLALHSIEPVILVSRAANDWDGAWCMAHVIEHLVGLP